jgi:hypothetical protein
MSKFQIRHRSDFTGEYQSYAVASQIQVDRRLSRFLIHTLGQAPAPPNPQKNNEEYIMSTDEHMAFDGEKTTSYTKLPGLDKLGNESKRFIENAQIIPGREPHWIINPEEFIGSHGPIPLATYLSEDSWTFLEAKGDVVGLESIGLINSSDPSKGEHRYRFWFDTSKNMAPARKEGCLKRSGDSGWRPYVIAEADNWWKAAEGLWLPQSYREDHYGIPEGAASYLIRSAVASITYSGINEDYPDAMFKLKIPGGFAVHDVVRGTNYKTRIVNDHTIERDARKAEELRAAYEAARSAPSIPEKAEPRWARIIVAVLSGLIVAAVAIGYAGWQWHRKRPMIPARSI